MRWRVLRNRPREVALASALALAGMVASGGGALWAQGPGGPPPGPSPTPQASATVDLTGYWVSLVTEDWHWRMSLPEKGDVASIPFTLDEEKRAILDEWDPERDLAGGNACKAYGAAAIMRVPTRVRIAWEDASTLRLETDAGMQTRLFRFDLDPGADPGERSLQGHSAAQWWQPPGGRGRGARGLPGPPPPADGGDAIGDGRGGPDPGPATDGTLEVVTTNLSPGYLRKNGVPYSDRTKVTEYFHRTPETYGDTYMIVTTIVEDPEYLTGPFITSSHFRKLPDTDNGWNPTPCSVY